MSLIWYLNRLARMSLAEMQHRASEQIKRHLSRRRNYNWKDFESEGPPPILPGLRDSIIANTTEDLKLACKSSVNAVLRGEYTALGVEWPVRDPADLFPDWVWRLDPVTRKLWPGSETFCFDIEYRHRREIGDIKYVWEFNRLQFLQPLSMAVALWSDKRALHALETAILHWSQANPPFRGICWNSGIELGLRACSLLFAASLCAEHLRPAVYNCIRTVLVAHLFWLGRFPSRFSSANNHIVAEVMGEYLIATAVPEVPQADSIVQRAQETLEQEAGIQILEDGTGAEQSPTYGAFTAEMLLICAFVGHAVRRPLGTIVDERLAAFAQFIGWMSNCHGRVPSIGDDDEGRVLTRCGAIETCYPASIAAAIAGYLKVPAFGPLSTDVSEIRDAVFASPKYSTQPLIGTKSFEKGGYTVIAERSASKLMRLVMDHGPLGYLSIAAHGHADANAITLSLDNEDILVDAGTFLYHAGGEWRDWFRSTPAHSTLNLEGTSQSIIAGPFNWSHKANARRIRLQEGACWCVVGQHDGYRNRFGVDHQREIRSREHGIEIVDRLLPESSSIPAEVVFQFASGINVVEQGTRVLVSRVGLPLLLIEFSERGEIAVAVGEGPSRGGWVSPHFGLKIAAARLVWRGIVPEKGLCTKLTWSQEKGIQY
jgi:hypothetical protein